MVVFARNLQSQASRTAENERQRQQDGGKYGDDEPNRVERGVEWLNDRHVLERASGESAGFERY